MEQKQLPKIALGAWAWGNDGTFGGALTSEELRPVFEAGMKAGLNLQRAARLDASGFQTTISLKLKKRKLSSKRKG